MSKLKVEKLRQTILKELALVIQTELKDNSLGFVTITDVRVTNDLSIATVYVNFLGAEERQDAGLKTLNRSKGFLRTALAKKLTMRKAPDLKFEIDTSLEKGNRIDAILRDIKKED